MATSISTSSRRYCWCRVPAVELPLLAASLLWLVDVRVDAAWTVSAQSPENVSDNNSAPYYNTSSDNDLVFTDNLQPNGSRINFTSSTALASNETHNETTVGDDLVFTILTSTILGLMILVTVVGNVFVIAAILLERHLHSVANYLIVSLAVADLLVACLVMPLGAVYEISRQWILGPELCDMWTSSDVLCCTASILHLVAIAVDRYWAVTNVDYIYNRNVGRIGTMIVLVWGVSLLLSLAPLFGWKDADYLERVNIHKKCIVSQDMAYQVVATCATFYVPLTVILILYWKIFQTARKRIRRRPGKIDNSGLGIADKTQPRKSQRWLLFRHKKWFCKPSTPETSTGTGHDNYVKPSDDPPTFQIVLPPSHSVHQDTLGANDEPHVMETTAFTINVPAPVLETHLDSTILEPQPLLSSSKNGSNSQYSLNNGSTTHLCQSSAAELHLQQKPPGTPTPAGDRSTGKGPINPSTSAKKEPTAQRPATVREKKETLEAKREKKAAKTLAIITGAFVVCWLPFFVCAITMPFCPQCHFDDTMLSVFLWLGYFNSTLNPVLYTIFSPEFRQAFKRLLCGKSSITTSAYRPRKLR